MAKNKGSHTRVGKKQMSEMLQQFFMHHAEETYSLKQIFKALRLDTHPAKMLAVDTMEDMAWDDYLSKVSENSFRLNTKGQVLTGRFLRKPNGKNSVIPDENGKPVFVAERNSMFALNGDRVQVAMMARRRNHIKEAMVTKIIERAHDSFVGKLLVEKDFALLVPDSRTFMQDIIIPRKKLKGGKTGEKAVVKIIQWPSADNKSIIGEVVDVLGKMGENDVEMHAILAQYGLPYKYPKHVEEAANRISGEITENDYKEREDFRSVTTFTIDPKDAKDFDDALSIRRLDNGNWEVGVHIADVTHYVRPHSVIDDEAVERGTSVYLVDRTVPMLPERLSNELCSLRPDEDSLCFSAVFTLNENLDILDEWFGRTVIHSDRRFTYAEAQEIIETGRGDYAEEVLTLNRLAQELRRQRFRNGAISFEREEMKFQLDETGRPIGVCFKEQKESNQMIEEFMLLANRRVAEFCSHRVDANGRRTPRTMVYRVHDTPSEEKLDRFRQFILRFGILFKASKGRAVAREMNKLFAKIKGSTEENAVTTMAVRSMAKAFYTTDNIGHYGLAFPSYTHFTSPIRRYPDMMVHRLLARYLSGGKSADKQTLEELCVRASEREVIAAEAERASIKYKMVEFMKERIGEEFEGHISGLTEWGVYVELDETHIEGMSFLRDVEGDFFDFDEQRYEIVGRSTGLRMTLGDPVRIRIKRADLQKRQLDFDLLLPGLQKSRPRVKNRR